MSLSQRFSIVLILSLTAVAALLAQGPLTPPGPPAPLMKSLDQIEPRTPISSLPFVITRPGSYYFTQNLEATPEILGASPAAVHITAPNVPLDLDGFTLSSTAAVATQSGINLANAATPLRGIRIMNGTISGTTGTRLVRQSRLDRARHRCLRSRHHRTHQPGHGQRRPRRPMGATPFPESDHREPCHRLRRRRLPDAAEYAAATDPRHPAALLRIVSHAYTNAGTAVTLEFTSQPNRLYSIEHTDDLVQWAYHDPFNFVIAPAPGAATTLVPFTAPAGPRRFFRVGAFKPLDP